LEDVPELDLAEVTIVRGELAKKFIALIARVLGTWQKSNGELEYLIAEVFSRPGFSAELTPGSKDGGKDIFLTCRIASSSKRYFVEIKHCRTKHLSELPHPEQGARTTQSRCRAG
jgi:restriction system protein